MDKLRVGVLHGICHVACYRRGVCKDALYASARHDNRGSAFATARQMIVEHLNVYETLVGIGAIAALFAIRKFLFCSFDEADHMICRGSQTVAHANLITGAKIPEEKTRILRSVISDKLSEEGKTVA